MAFGLRRRQKVETPEQKQIWKQRWEAAHLDKGKGLAIFVRDLILEGYDMEYPVRHDKAGSIYRVDFANLKTRHIIQLNGKHNSTKVRQAADKVRDAKLEGLGWKVTRVSYDRVQKL